MTASSVVAAGFHISGLGGGLSRGRLKWGWTLFKPVSGQSTGMAPWMRAANVKLRKFMTLSSYFSGVGSCGECITTFDQEK